MWPLRSRFDKSCRELPISDGDLILNITKRLEANRHAVLLWFERSHINGEAILYIRIGQSLVSLVDLLDWDDFYVGSDVMFAAKVEHLLRFGNTPDERARETATLQQKAKGRDGMRLVRCADEGDVAVAAE